jgi:hypothetical protein
MQNDGSTMPKKKDVPKSAIHEASSSLGSLPDAPPRKRKAHKRPNRTADTIKTENIEVVWAEDTKPGVQRVNFPLRVDPDVLEWFGDRAVEVGKDRSVLARIALNEYIERNS